MKNDRRQKKRREIASKLTKPKPVELPSGAFRCQVMVGGKRIDVVDDDPEVAHAKALALKSGVIQEQAKSPKSMTVGEAIDKYIESKDSVLSPSTIVGYKKQRKNTFQELMDVRIGDLRPEDVQRSVNRMAKEKSPKYVRNAYGLLTAALSVYAPGFVLHTTLPQRKKPDISIPSEKEISMIAEDVKGKKFELPFLLAAWLGLRTSEIRGLTWDCVEGDTIHIKQALVDGTDGPTLKSTKTYSGDRRLPLPKYLQELIEAQPKSENDDYIVHYNRNQLYKCLYRSCRRLGIQRYRFHDLRHYQASVLLALGIPDKYAMERMGHASTNMLKNVYQHTMQEQTLRYSEQVDTYFEKQLHRKRTNRRV